MDLTPIDSDDSSEVYIFNPTKSDFSHSYAMDNGMPTLYTLKSYEGKKFPKIIADHLAKHLANKIVGEMSGVITEETINEVLSTIYL